ncbi:mechanosensitive ion channel family protein [Jannaschia rubra]|uniref:Potassium efflux system KefA n=1 Tax=Jannaschia rubra TaxID=282197 RepID=A0A0M6XPL1_9RHOB|nr:mechanosensitive ion channel domain-containing protein [Jannaschia rubra]CTQ33080.1 Potassium efflux system KefA precursor [Jannaschia rubra]SFG74533.1 Small-conductance mechanosensitive channel [Jannaschia rubra]
MSRILPILFAVLAALLTLPALAQDSVFEIPELNAGLGPVPDRIDLRTPRSAMASFLRAARDGDWDAAAHVLDLAETPPERQPVEGPVLARQLFDVIDRKAVLDWGILIDRPDALQTRGGENAPQAGEPRRSLLLRDLPLDLVPAAIRLNRVQPADAEDAVWIFPSETVRDVPALHRAYGPSRFEMMLPEMLRTDAFGGLMWWELIGMPLLLAGAIAIGWVVHRILRRLWRRADGRVATGILRALSTPLIIASVTTLVWWVTGRVFVFSGRIDVFLAPAVAIGFVTAILLFIVNGVEVLLDNLIAPGEDVDLTRAEQTEARILATRLNAAKRVLVVVVFVIGTVIVLTSANLFQDIGLSLLASAGALTLVLGFAARSILGNVLASLQIALNQSARVGDRVVYKDELCHVERIHMTFVQLRNWDGTRLVVPVEEFVSETFSNWSLQEPAMLRVLELRLDPAADVEALRQAFHEALSEVADTDLGEELGDLDGASVNVSGQDVFGMEVWFSLPCTDPNTSWEVACAVRERLLARAARIEQDTGKPVFPRNVAAGAT